MINISVIAVVYNEEERIENFIKCFLWSDDLTIIDKSSTDKTEEIVKKYISPNVHYIKVPYFDHLPPDDIKDSIDLLKLAKNEWFMPITASDLIDHKLVDIINKVINTDNFNYGVIGLPYKMYTFGICDKHSPWSYKEQYINTVYKKDQFVSSNQVHKERDSSGKVFRINDLNNGYFYHLTHRNLDIFYERHLRYSVLETNKHDDPKIARKETMRGVLRAIKRTFFTKKTYKLGWDGMALTLAYISYYIMTYLAVWQKFNKKGESVYQEITNDVLEKYNKN